MQARTFIIGAQINTKRLLAVFNEDIGMVGYSCDRSISDTWVHVKEYGYFVRYNFFTMGYEEYTNAALYLELPVITNYQYNEYATALEHEYAVSMALKGSFTDKQMDSLKEGLTKLDVNFPGTLIHASDDYDIVVDHIRCMRRCAVMEGDKTFDVGTALIKDREAYDRLQHYALHLIVWSKSY